MVQTPRAVPLGELRSAVGAAGLTCVRLPDPDYAVRGVVVHAPDDPAPPASMLVLCTDPVAGVPDAAALVVRAGVLDGISAGIGDRAAVFTAPDGHRWSDVYDDLQWVLGESFGRSAERDVFQLADALASALGGAVAIEDAQRRVVAFSTIPGQPIDDVRREGILDRQVPAHVERDRWYSRLWRTDGVVEFPAGPESTARLALAIRIGGEPVGSIWVVGARETLSDDPDAVLLGAADDAAACLAHQDHFATRSRELRRTLLRDLFDSRQRRRSTGIRLPGPSVLLGITRDPAGDEPELIDERLADVLSLHANRHRGSGIAGVVADRVYALLPAMDRVRLEGTVLPIVRRVVGENALVCFSSVIDAVDDIAEARHRLDLALWLTSHRRSGAARDTDDDTEQPLVPCYVDDLRNEVLLAEIAGAVGRLPGLRSGPAFSIADYDAEHGSEYIQTLRAWFDSGGDVPAAAARIYVHANTFRYRMSRIRTLFEIDLESADERLLVHLQLRLIDFLSLEAGTDGGQELGTAAQRPDRTENSRVELTDPAGIGES